MAYINKITQTKTQIINSFLQLLLEKNFQNITINDITEKSKINRSTFYRHYLDKYDLLDKIENEVVENINNNYSLEIPKMFFQNDIDDFEKFSNRALILFDLVHKNLEVISILFSNNTQTTLKVKLLKLVKKNINYATENLPELKKIENKDMLIAYASATIIGLLEYWIEHKEKTPKEIFNFWSKLLRGALRELVTN